MDSISSSFRRGLDRRASHSPNADQIMYVHLADVRAIASRTQCINLAGSLRGAWKQATRRRLLHGAKGNGVGG